MIKVNNEIVNLNHFPDGTLNIKRDEIFFNKDVIISWHYHDDAEFMAVAFLTKAYQSAGSRVSLFLPYVPNGRMDRVKDAEDVFTLKYFGELINSLHFERVCILDAHSNVSAAIIKNCVHIHNDLMRTDIINYITEVEGDTPIMFFPDEGSMKRYSNNINIPFAFGMKNRDWKSGQIIGYEVMGMTAEEIKGKNVLIQDDICSKGGTFYHAAKKLKEMGAANIYLLVTHCENNIHNGKFGEDGVSLLNTGLVKHVFTTNSIYSLGDSEMISVSNLDLNILDGKFDLVEGC